MSVFKFSRVDFCLTVLGLLFLLLDVVLDALTVLDFFWEREWVRLALLLLFLVGSSLLVQVYSWLWYKYEDFHMQTRVEKKPSRRQLKVLHVLQLGTYLRHAGVMEMGVRMSLTSKGDAADLGDVAVFLIHDVALLRIVETFSESLPQLVLMVTTNIQRGHLDTLPVLKSVASALAVSFTVTSYHRTLRRFLKDKKKQSVFSSLVYFLWNLLLMAARVAALSLFASEFPCFVLPHFLCSWVLLFFCAWRSHTDFMGGDECGERLYRATVGLIWYFNWFNVVEGRTFCRTLLYHIYILTDITLLCGLWFWRKNPDLRNFDYQHLIAFFCILFVYLFGLLVKSIYYHCFHPNVTKEELRSDEEEQQTELESPRQKFIPDEPDPYAVMTLTIETDSLKTPDEPDPRVLSSLEIETDSLKFPDEAGPRFFRSAVSESASVKIPDKLGSRAVRSAVKESDSVKISDDVDSAVFRSANLGRSTERKINKRMMKLANNFYS